MNFFRKLPTTANALLGVLGVLGSILFLVFRGQPGMLALVTGLYVVVGAIAGLGVFFYERDKKAKSGDFAKSLATNAASEKGLKDPNEIAKANEMAKEFQRGIDIYVQRGKPIDSLPWYVVVGESESGKTEMIRRSEIGFPPDLQEYWQGAGGTRSMHWWFTNRAVIIDTAGRLFVSEGPEAEQPQWLDFLQLVKRKRPDCPINGLILVIPASRLLTHPNPALEATGLTELDRNAGQIAKQMETLQTILGIRFPVYIIITKMDKLNGFREFFGKIEKAEDRYQIVGWSNPVPIGEPFDPQTVVDYMHSVADRLKRRMMSELRHVEPENPASLRIDEVDALYAFPTSFESMTGKLTRYLRHIFTTNEWSAKPPFLRGIYFTSALQTGKVLDEAMAAAMGVAFDRMETTQPDDGFALSKNRTYFVRDLFLDKIFNEKGLVTTAAKIKTPISGWKLWVPASILLMLATVAILGWLAKNSCPEIGYWDTLFQSGKAGCRILPLATWNEPELVRAPADGESDKPGANETLEALSKLGGEVGEPPKFRWIFAPAQWFDRRLDEDRPTRYSSLVAESLAGLEDALIARYESESNNLDDWEPADWRALQALIVLRTSSTWSPGKLARDKRDKSPFETAQLVKALFAAARLEAAPEPLVESINLALALPSANFQHDLTVQRKRDVKKLLNDLTPRAELADVQKRTDLLNNLAEALAEADLPPSPPLSKAVDYLAAIDPLPVKATTETADPDTAEDPKDSPHPGGLCSNKLKFTEWVRSSAAAKALLDYQDSGRPLTPEAKILDHPIILRHLRVSTRILDGKDSLTATNFDDFARPPAEVIKLAGKSVDTAKKLLEVLTKFDGFKKAWFRDTFVERQLLDHLRFPLVKDSPGLKEGDEASLGFLWKLVQHAKVTAPDCKRIKKLDVCFDFFFDSESIKKNEKVLDAWRKCEIKLLARQAGKANKDLVIKIDPPDGGQDNVVLNMNVPNPPPLPVTLNRSITFYLKDGGLIKQGEISAWGLIRRINVDSQPASWYYQTDSGVPGTPGARYEIGLAGQQKSLDVLMANWQNLKDFDKPCPPSATP